MPTLNTWNRILNEKQTLLKLLTKQKRTLEDRQKEKEKELVVKEEAQSIIQTAAQMNQITLKTQLSLYIHQNNAL